MFSQEEFSTEELEFRPPDSPQNVTYTPSIRRILDRITSDPSAVESEVETKMCELRERYRQLQYCLSERSVNPSPPPGNPQSGDRSEEDNDTNEADELKSVTSKSGNYQ